MTTKEKNVKSFKDLDRDELYRSAIEDFAIDIEEDASADDIRAEFLAVGIKWADYAKQHPEVAPAKDKEKEPINVVTSSDVSSTKANDVVEEAPVAVITAEPAIKPTSDKYLIKMVRDNTLYETRGYKFTQEHPYALVNSEDADFILSKEDGFRQAFPSELAEFYG